MEKVFLYILANLQDFFVGGFIVSCVTIAIMGILKKVVFNRITNKLARKCALAFSSVAMVLPVTAFSLIGNEIALQNFWCIYGVNAILTVFTYWLYENTGLRDLIGYTGNTILKKYAEIIYTVIQGDSADTAKTKLIDTNTALREAIKKNVKKSNKDDKDLKNV